MTTLALDFIFTGSSITPEMLLRMFSVYTRLLLPALLSTIVIKTGSWVCLLAEYQTKHLKPIKILFLGNCGISQPVANDALWFLCWLGFCPRPELAILSHNVCNEFYISAFENDFLATNENNCPGVLRADELPEKFKMGYMETRRK